MEFRPNLLASRADARLGNGLQWCQWRARPCSRPRRCCFRSAKYLGIVHSAWSCETHLRQSPDRLEPWLDRLDMHKNQGTVALPAEIARILRVMPTSGSRLSEAGCSLRLIPAATDCEVRERDDEPVDNRIVEPVREPGQQRGVFIGEWRARILSWPGRNSGPLARSPIHLCRLAPSPQIGLCEASCRQR
jgi:hypothetical protein